MRRGMVDNEFFLVYQPQVDMRTGDATGVEALLRWRDPVRGEIAPTEFIPIAEESGMIQALGVRALREACRQVIQWHRQEMPMLPSVPLSVQQLRRTVAPTSATRLRAYACRANPRPRNHRKSDHHPPRKGRGALVQDEDMGCDDRHDFGTGY